MSHPQIKKIHHRGGCSDKHINNYKIPSERTVPEFRYFVLLLFTDGLLSLCFYGTAEMPMCHGQLVPQTKAESTHWAHSGNSRQLFVSLSVLILWRQWDHCHISRQILSNCWTIPQDTRLHDSTYYSCLTEMKKLFLSVHQLCHYAEGAALCNICQSCSAFLLCSPSTATSRCWHLPEMFQACKHPVDTLEKTSCIIIVQIPLLSLPWQKKANSNFNEIKQGFFLYSSATPSIHTNLYHLPIAQFSAILQYMERCIFIHEIDPTKELLTCSKLRREACSGTLGKI